MILRSNRCMEFCVKYCFSFGEFPDQRYHVYRTYWESPKVTLFGRIVKKHGLWVFSPVSDPTEEYYGGSRVDAVKAYLVEHPLVKEV